MKRILVTSAKGGGGKSTLARNLAVAAATSGLRVATLDLDAQKTLTNWYGRRPEGAAEFAHYAATMDGGDVRGSISSIDDADVLIIDTPPSIEDYPEAFRLLAKISDLVLIPTGQSVDDLDSVRPWMRFVLSTGKRAAFVLNRVKPRTKAFLEARNMLMKDGPVCPVELPDFEDVPLTSAYGIGIAELRGAKCASHMEGIWMYVRGQAGV